MSLTVIFNGWKNQLKAFNIQNLNVSQGKVSVRVHVNHLLSILWRQYLDYEATCIIYVFIMKHVHCHVTLVLCWTKQLCLP